jgi:crossover junction endodeoxyribonuclease RusA
MNPILAIQVPGIPVAKDRPRLGRNGHVYTPRTTSAWESALAWQATSAMGGRRPTDAPVSLIVIAVHPRPKSRPERVPGEVWRSGSRCPAVTRKDLDNVVKAAADGLNGVAWVDDRQVAHLEAFSLYAAAGEGPSVSIRVVEL